MSGLADADASRFPVSRKSSRMAARPLAGGRAVPRLENAVLDEQPDQLGDRFTRARPGRVAVRVVARPEDVLQARLVAHLHPGMVLDEGRVSLPIPVAARRLGDDRLGPEAVLLESRVHALEVVGYPADPGLDHDEDEARVALANAAEDELRDQLADPHGRERDEGLAHARRRIEEAR